MSQRYVRPDWFTAHVFNPLVAFLTSRGISVWGSRVLAVRGRSSGEWRTTPVNVLTYQGQRYLVAPRGVTQWGAEHPGQRRRGAPARGPTRADPHR